MKRQGPIKVAEATREKIRYAAAVSQMTQGRLVETAIDEYLTRHAADINAGIERARAALRADGPEPVAYLLGEGADEAPG